MSSLEAVFQTIEELLTALGPLAGEVVFVGGAVASLFITDPILMRVRPTKDIDLIVQKRRKLDLLT